MFRLAGGEILQAETGAPSGGAHVVDNFVDLNNDDTARGRAYVALDNTGATLTLSNVDGGSGGVGAVELRYSSGFADFDVVVRVNGTPYDLVLPETGNDPAWRHTIWRQARLEGVAFDPGTSNTVQISTQESFPNLSLDDVLISTPDHLALAQPHRQVLSLPQSDREALLAFLRQLDGSDAETGSPPFFADGFESGDAAAWSSSTPLALVRNE